MAVLLADTLCIYMYFRFSKKNKLNELLKEALKAYPSNSKKAN